MILRAGCLTATYRDGELWHVRIGSHEVAQRIYGAVRDRNWGTVRSRIRDITVTDSNIVFEAAHQEGEIDFRWRGAITASPGGTISFAMNGRAHSPFLRNRIGLCLHHPLRECTGVECEIKTTDGMTIYSRFPELVAPQQPFLNVRALRYGDVTIYFHGDVFETEDHRNWTDANFKTYSTPLELPFPIEVHTGEEVRQSIEIKQVGMGRCETPVNPIVSVKACGPCQPMPAIGLVLGATPLSNPERNALRHLRLSHLRVDGVDNLRRAHNEANSIGAELEIAVTLPCCIPQPFPKAERWLIYQHGEKATEASAASALRLMIGPEAVVAVGTNAYFAELNRNRPSGDGWDAVCFSVNPQVHAFDDESVMANAAAQYDVAVSARQFPGVGKVVVSPVTLAPRFALDATGQFTPPPPDPRQKTSFCAAWTVASLQALANGEASSVTYFETHGPRGIMDEDKLYPVYRVFESIERIFTKCLISDTSRIAALAFGSRYLVANLTPADCRVEVQGVACTLRPYEVQNIEGRTWS